MDNSKKFVTAPEISEQDILEAMKAVQGYLDITPGDFKQIYKIAYSMAITRLLSTITASDLMTKKVLLLEQTMSLVDAATILAEKQYSGAPVVDGKKYIVGIVSEKDFLKEMGFGTHPSFMQIATHCLHDKSCMIGNLRDRTVSDIMTKPPVVGQPETTVSDISTIFAEKKINRLPIISKNGEIVGIVTRTDLAQAYKNFAGGQQL